MFRKLENLKTWKLENFENMKNDPWDMLNNFCFHVYAQKSLFIGQNVNGFFWQHPVSLEVIELVPVPVFLLDRVTRQLSTSGPTPGMGPRHGLLQADGAGAHRRCHLHLICTWSHSDWLQQISWPLIGPPVIPTFHGLWVTQTSPLVSCKHRHEKVWQHKSGLGDFSWCVWTGPWNQFWLRTSVGRFLVT